jgi:hypothetical protein
MDARLRTQVRDRAGGRCEYCRIHEDDDPFFTFPIDHRSFRRPSAPSFASTSLPPRFLLVDRRLGDPVHGGLSRFLRGYTHLYQQREPPCFVVMKSILRWSDRGNLLLAIWSLQSLHHPPHLMQGISVVVVA